MNMTKFDKSFLIGAATAAHQTEGNNIHSDFWAQENMIHTSYVEPSLNAVDHYNRYPEDIRLMAQAGLNAYRFSLEWARIEPEEGKFDEKEIEHYRDVIDCCRKNGIEPVVTLLHFSSPKWLICKGGWEAETTPADFARYTEYVMSRLGSELKYVCTINEANMGIQIAAISKQIIAQIMKAQESGTANESQAQMGINIKKMLESREETEKENIEVFGVKDPQVFTSGRTERGDELVMEAHKAAKEVIRRICPDIKVGLTLSLHDIQAVEGGEASAEKEWEEEFTHYLPSIQDDDFLGIQNYTRTVHNADGAMTPHAGAELTQMDYEYYPEGLEHVLRRVAEVFPHDLIVTENGIATADDARRIDFIETALKGVRRCVEDGLPVKGYLHWSLLDNFEWQKGFSMQFGLIAVDRSTMTRLPKPSLKYLGSFRGYSSEHM